MTAYADKPVEGRNRCSEFVGSPDVLALAVFRLPLPLYQRGWGWLLGQAFLLVAHAVRNFGKGSEAAESMALTYGPRSPRSFVVFSGWGPNAGLDTRRWGPPGAADPDRARGVYVAEQSLPLRGRERRRAPWWSPDASIAGVGASPP